MWLSFFLPSVFVFTLNEYTVGFALLTDVLTHSLLPFNGFLMFNELLIVVGKKQTVNNSK